MIEKRMIAVTAYRTPDGSPACATDFSAGNVCQFLTTRKFGLVEVCMVCRLDIQRDDGGVGHLVPVDGCPVWHGDKS